jgi:hypothetical protein
LPDGHVAADEVLIMSDTDDDPEAVEPTEVDLVDMALDFEVQQRLWIKAIGNLLEQRKADSDPSPRVQFAIDCLYVAACERGVRILSADLPRNP